MTFKEKCKIIKAILKGEKICYNEFENRDVIEVAKYNNKLEQMAKDILVKNDMLKLPVNLIEIANNNNIEVYSVSLPVGISGSIKYNSKVKKYQILIDENEPEYRKRFTIAHELAHFFLKDIDMNSLHYDVLYRSELEYDDKERKADYLAGALLMDKDMLTKLYKVNPSIKELAGLFNVSESAMTVRLFYLGIL